MPNRTPELTRCIGCRCKTCEQVRKIILENLTVSALLVNEVTATVNLCEEGFTLSEEMLVNYTNLGRQMMILDIGALVSLAGVSWMTQYLKEFDLTIGEMKSTECSQIFRFGLSRPGVATAI